MKGLIIFPLDGHQVRVKLKWCVGGLRRHPVGGGREGRVGLTTKPPFVRPSSWDAWDASSRKNVIEIAVNDTGSVIYDVQ